MVEMQKTLINGRWSLLLPEHRAAREQWGAWTDPSTGESHFGWEAERWHSISLNVGPGDVVYDIGTEEGDLSALMQFFIGRGDGGVCLFEPNDRVWPNIRAIWDANELKPPLATWVGFAGDMSQWQEGTTQLGTFDHWPECAYGPIIGDHGFAQLNERPDIPAIRLDDFFDWTNIRPDVVTMDVEGSELRVLHGAQSLLMAFLPIVYVSVHDTFMAEQYNDDPQELYDFMAQLGYRSKVLAEDHERHVVFWHPEGRELRFG